MNFFDEIDNLKRAYDRVNEPPRARPVGSRRCVCARALGSLQNVALSNELGAKTRALCAATNNLRQSSAQLNEQFLVAFKR